MKPRKLYTGMTALFLGLALSLVGVSGPASATPSDSKPFPPKCTKVDSPDPSGKCIVLY